MEHTKSLEIDNDKLLPNQFCNLENHSVNKNLQKNFKNV